jgi:3-oxoacyl-[acyl-carrier protein] reductase
MTEIKLGALRRFCLAAIPEMRKLQWGRIVNISSIGGIYPNPKLLISHALSAAINNITKSLALEVAKDGILVNAIGIGAVATDNWANNMIPAVRRERSEFAEFTDEVVIALQSCGGWLVRDRENPSGWHIRHRSSGLRAGL